MRSLQLAAMLVALSPMVISAQKIRADAITAQLHGPNVHLVTVSRSTQIADLENGSNSYLSGFQSDADRADFLIQAPTGGLYDLAIAFRSSGRKGFAVKVNGLEIAGTIEATPDRSFVLQTVGAIELSKGDNVVEIEKGWGYYDVQSILLTASPQPEPTLGVSTVAVDPQVTPEAAALLHRLDTTYGKTTILGVYSGQDAQYVADTTGLLPGIMGGDLLRYSPQEVAHGSHPERADEVDRLIAASKAGYIVTLSWHWCAPSGLLDTKEKPWWRGFYSDSTTFDIEKTLATPQSTDYATMLADIDAIAVQLRRLQDAHVAVLWRPLHEASGGWFWWGAKGPKPFVDLWKLLYERLTIVDKIHNLIWVYTDDGQQAWYPGDGYADVIGIDAYPKDLRDPESQLWMDLRRAYGNRKLLAISEFGGVPDVPRMQRMGEFWSYAVSWSGKEGPRKNTEEELKRIYSDPGVTTMPPPVPPMPVHP